MEVSTSTLGDPPNDEIFLLPPPQDIPRRPCSESPYCARASDLSLTRSEDSYGSSRANHCEKSDGRHARRCERPGRGDGFTWGSSDSKRSRSLYCRRSRSRGRYHFQLPWHMALQPGEEDGAFRVHDRRWVRSRSRIASYSSVAPVRSCEAPQPHRRDPHDCAYRSVRVPTVSISVSFSICSPSSQRKHLVSDVGGCP